jgi:8-oxo-dGTP diphosphatase
MLIVNDQKQILISDEFQVNMKMSKFPGGGMEYGEGTIECLQREAMEEFGQKLTNIRHFYTTDYYQKAYFFKDHQLMSIYYLADLADEMKLRVSDKPFDFANDINGQQSFRWISLDKIDERDLSFPIDKKVIGLIKKRFQ